MAAVQEHGGRDIGVEAAEDLSAKQYHGISVTGDKAYLADAANARGTGVLQNKPKSGRQARIRIDGTTKYKSAEAIDAGTLLTLTASATFEEVDAAGEYFMLQAIESVVTAGDIGEAIFARGTAYATDATAPTLKT